MLTSKEMTPDDFEIWQEANQWFFDALRERRDELKETVDDLLTRFSEYPFSFTDVDKQNLIIFAQRAAALDYVCSIEYEEIVEVEDDVDG